MKPLASYPTNIAKTLDGVYDAVQNISRTRQDDQTLWNNLNNEFGSGRRVAKIPATSNDIASTDNIGDFNTTFQYAYFCVADAGGSATWVRAPLLQWF